MLSASQFGHFYEILNTPLTRHTIELTIAEHFANNSFVCLSAEPISCLKFSSHTIFSRTSFVVNCLFKIFKVGLGWGVISCYAMFLFFVSLQIAF